MVENLQDVCSLRVVKNDFSDGFVFPIGRDTKGEVFEVDLSDDDTRHLLLSGPTGVGKSYLLNQILEAVTKIYGPEDLNLFLTDPKQLDLEVYCLINLFQEFLLPQCQKSF